MSSYKRITRHPNTGIYEIAFWQDDYFGPHEYGVLFASDKITYPSDKVSNAQLKEFWADDVINAFQNWISDFTESEEINHKTLEFLEELNKVYNLRWKSDPIGGNGAVKNLREKRKNES